MATYKLNSYGVVEYPTNAAEDNPFINSTEVAEHFPVKEFTCTKPGDTTWIHPQLAYALEKAGSGWRSAIAIYRNRSAYGLRGVGLYDYAGSDADDSYIHVDVGPGSSAPSLKEGMKREERPSFGISGSATPCRDRPTRSTCTNRTKSASCSTTCRPAEAIPATTSAG